MHGGCTVSCSLEHYTNRVLELWRRLDSGWLCYADGVAMERDVGMGRPVFIGGSLC